MTPTDAGRTSLLVILTSTTAATTHYSQVPYVNSTSPLTYLPSTPQAHATPTSAYGAPSKHSEKILWPSATLPQFQTQTTSSDCENSRAASARAIMCSAMHRGTSSISGTICRRWHLMRLSFLRGTILSTVNRAGDVRIRRLDCQDRRMNRRERALRRVLCASGIEDRMDIELVFSLLRFVLPDVTFGRTLTSIRPLFDSLNAQPS